MCADMNQRPITLKSHEKSVIQSDDVVMAFSLFVSIYNERHRCVSSLVV